MISESLAVIIAIVTTLAVIWVKRNNGVCKSKRRLDGKTCLVTGGTAGIGLETAKELAKRGARVIVACPFPQEGHDAEKTIKKETGNQNVMYKELNLASLQSTREFAQDILQTEHRLDVLINNAGVGSINELTKDGMLFTMQINYYGHFLLTNLLLPLLKKTGTPEDKSRIVNVASLLHYTGHYDFGNMNKPGFRSYLQSYSNSKLCLLLFAQELAKRLKGSNVVVNSIEPGTVGTRIYKQNFGKFGGLLIKLWLLVFSKTPWEGAQTSIYAAIDESVGDTNGGFFSNCKLVKAKDSAYDAEAAQKLWMESEKLVKWKALSQVADK